MSKRIPDNLVQAYQKWRTPLLRLLKRKVVSHADAEDLTQESFLRWAMAGTQVGAGNERAYVTRIAMNAMHEVASRNSGAVGLTTSMTDVPDGYESVVDQAPSPQQQVENRQLLERLQQAINELPQRQQEAFVLHRFDGLSYQEVADQMGISVRMVTKHIGRAVAYCQCRAQYQSADEMLVHQVESDRDDIH